MPPLLFKAGDQVMARWPRSALYYDGIVKEARKSNYLIEFQDDDKSEFVVDAKFVRSVQSLRSSSKGRSPSRGGKSPARSPSRKTRNSRRSASKSPSRKVPKSLSRKAPISPAPENDEITVKKVETALAAKTEEVVEANNHVTTTRLTRSRVMETVVTDNSSTKYKDALEEARKILDLRAQPAVTPSYSKLQWVLYNTGNLVLLVVALVLPMTLQQACTKPKCSITTIPSFNMDPWKYFNQYSLGLMSCILLGTVLNNFLRIRVSPLPNGAESRSNGLLTLSWMSLTVFGLIWHKMFAMKMFYVMSRQLLTMHTLLGLFLGLVLYIKSLYCTRPVPNKEAKNMHIHDFMFGLEFAPRIGSFDVKTLLHRYLNLFTILLHVVLLEKADFDLKANVPFTVVTAMQLWMSFDLLLFEPSFLSSSDYKSQGCGLAYVLVSLVMPFMQLAVTRQVYHHMPVFELYQLGAIVSFYLVGYFMFRAASTQRHTFHTAPHHASVEKLEATPSASGRLLMGGYFGTIRHPVALGAIIMWCAICLTGGFVQPLAPLLMCMGVLCFTSMVCGTERRAKAKYGVAWDSYCARVKYVLLPYVY